MKYKAVQEEIDMINALLYEYDPIGIAVPDDEYIDEAIIIADGLRSMKSEQEVLLLVYHTFTSMFNNPGTIDTYTPIAHHLWKHIRSCSDQD